MYTFNITTIEPLTSITEIMINKLEYVDLCNLQYVDTVLILNHRIFINKYRLYV